MDMREKEIRDRVEALGWKVLKTDAREVRTELTEEQLESMAKDVDKHIGEHLRLENEKKKVDKVLKDQMDEHEAIFRALSKVRADGFEDKMTKVLIVADIAGKVRRIFSLATGLQVGQEVMQDSDLQEEMPIKTEPKKKAEKPKDENGVIEIGFESRKSESGEVSVDGIEISEAEYEVLGEMETPSEAAPEARELVTQIRSVEKKNGAYFITTAENEVFFTDKAGDFEMAKYNIETNKNQAEMGSGISAYVKIKYLDSNTRNKQLLEIEERDVVTTGVDADDQLPEGIEEGSDPDEGATGGADDMEAAFEEVDESEALD